MGVLYGCYSKAQQLRMTESVYRAATVSQFSAPFEAGFIEWESYVITFGRWGR